MSRSMYKVITANSGIGAEDPGCGSGPAAIINHLLFNQLIHHERKTELVAIYSLESSTQLKGLHALNEIKRLNKLLAEETRQAVKNDQFFIVLGGDHSCGIGTWSGVLQASAQPFTLIWIDAHLDSHTMATTPSNNIHGMPVAALLGYGHNDLTTIGNCLSPLLPENLIIIGARHYEAEELALLNKLQVKIIFIDDIEQHGIEYALNQAVSLAREKNQRFGISIDMDAFDPTEIPGTGTPVVNGINFNEFSKWFAKTAQTCSDLLGVEICEFNPFNDYQDKTLYAILELLTPLYRDINFITPLVKFNWKDLSKAGSMEANFECSQ